MLLIEMLLAVAEINNQAQCKRKIDAAREKRDLLRDGIFEYLYIIFGEIFDQGPTGIADGKSQIDKVRVRSKDLGLLAESKARQHQKQSCKRTHNIDALVDQNFHSCRVNAILASSNAEIASSRLTPGKPSKNVSRVFSAFQVVKQVL